MTCIIGMVQDGKVYMGGDSQVSRSGNFYITQREKVFRVGEFIIGSAGSIRMSNIMQYHFSPTPIEIENIDRYMVINFVEQIRGIFKDLGFSTIENNVESCGEFLVGVRGKLYRIDSDFQVDREVFDIMAVGSGENHAMGAMLALSDLLPEQRIRRSLEIVSQLNCTVCAPFYVEILE